MSEVLVAAIGGLSIGLVVGWLLPVAHRWDWGSVLASGLAVVVVGVALFVLIGLPDALGAAAGSAIGVWLHIVFLEYVVSRPDIAKED